MIASGALDYYLSALRYQATPPSCVEQFFIAVTIQIIDNEVLLLKDFLMVSPKGMGSNVG